MKTEQSKVWFVTGGSKGLGRSLIVKLLDYGYKVAATSRDAAQLQQAVGRTENFLPLTVDLADEESVKKAIEATIGMFGRLDVIVNNAGYGIGGSIEELTNAEIKQAFDINIFGTINVIRAAMPQLRKQQSGHIINISSIAGFAPATGWAAYSAAKAAVIGMSEVLAEDVREFGVKVTVVMPGGFRTSFLKPESLVLSENKMPEYTAVRSTHERYKGIDGRQSGDPEKAPDVFIDLAENPNPPVRFFMGGDAVKRAWEKTEAIQENIKDWKITSKSTDF
ncbi:SDR family oxidoreductase [Flavobacterium selenitireducens]|uniref:SDR family oxidoreductase n=1 Tax=Flavobacterium selenitireducens TaxID=2722704 RepID=UPI00168B6EFF|nr:SDR family oxidoreductase [Flavobacterium selenitireducens]MBD3582871.1 SDR family oxidoreductase [Flavobacterium selenitireducens]